MIMIRTSSVLSLVLLVWLSGNSLLFAQKKNSNYRIHIEKTDAPIVLDGVLDEPGWQAAEVAKDFYMVLPMDTSYARSRTEVRLTYDANALYISAVCYDDQPGERTVESLRRDFSFGNNENFLLFMDPFDDQTNGFTFGANSAGAQWDGLMSSGSSVDLGWDNKWASKVQSYPDRWVLEASIPFKTIRYKKGITEWGIQFSRLDLKLNEKSAWAPVPRQFPTSTLAYTGVLVWDNPPPPAGTNISVIPYLAGSTVKNVEAGTPADNDFAVGGDAKVAVTSSLNLDLTVNPDFSQVEVDRQVTNLSRFELFFPERRQFFIENSDLFADLGFNNVRPFFSRRIGLNTPIRFGARLSGKVDKNWRIGVMNVQTDKVTATGRPAENFAVAAVQRQVFQRSNITGFLINKDALNYQGNGDFSKYDRTAGLEYNLASANNFWRGKVAYHQNMNPKVDGGTFMHAASINYDRRNINFGWQHEIVGDNYNPEVGFVPRRDYIRLNPSFGYTFFPKNMPKLVSHGPFIMSEAYYSRDGRFLESESFIDYTFQFLDRSSLFIWTSHNYLELRDPFDPTNTGSDTLAAGTDYSWHAGGFGYESKPSNLLTFEFFTRYGGYFGGTRLNLRGALGYRIQPYASLAVDVSYNDIQLDAPLNDAQLWLISPRLDLTFTNTMFLTAFAQYNNQADNMNLNVRFQWRYQPASDLFIVYTENYFPENFDSKNRALVLKLTYWWNI